MLCRSDDLILVTHVKVKAQRKPHDEANTIINYLPIHLLTNMTSAYTGVYYTQIRILHEAIREETGDELPCNSGIDLIV